MPRNKYPEETVQKILEAAQKLFLEKGYEQTTILDIVDNMGGMTRGAFYHHFKSKEEVLDALGDKLFYDSNPLEKLSLRKDLTGLEKIQKLIMNSNQDTDVRKISIMSAQALKSPTFLKKMIDDNQRILTPWCEKAIREGVEDGSIRTDHPRLLAELVVFLTNFWGLPTIYPCTLEESVEKLHFIREITDKMGISLLNNEMIAFALEGAAQIEGE